jgi:hypothetical protein
MVKHMEAKFGVLPNVFIYNALLDAASGDLHAALRVRVPQSPSSMSKSFGWFGPFTATIATGRRKSVGTGPAVVISRSSVVASGVADRGHDLVGTL